MIMRANRKDFELRLAKDFPNLYTDMHGNMSQTCMAWGIDTGLGWYGIICELSQKLENLIVAMPDDVRGEYKAAQVKEKFGTLRFYMTAETPEMSAVIREAEAASARTCEECGQEGKVRNSGWIRVLCDTCSEKREKK